MATVKLIKRKILHFNIYGDVQCSQQHFHANKIREMFSPKQKDVSESFKLYWR